jgi:hypothetical protein
MRRFCPQVTPSLVISLLALFVALGGTAIAATGGNFVLGQSNTASTKTQLASGVTTAGALAVINTGGRPAANFISNTGIPSISVSNAAKIQNLNADKLDGVDSTGFYKVNQKVANAAQADSATNAAALGGIRASGFVQGGGSVVQRHSLEPGTTDTNLNDYLTVPGFGSVLARCLSANGTLFSEFAFGPSVNVDIASYEGGGSASSFITAQANLGELVGTPNVTTPHVITAVLSAASGQGGAATLQLSEVPSYDSTHCLFQVSAQITN